MTAHQNGITTAADLKMPWIIYGTAWKKQRTADLVEQAVQTGFRGIDTACQPKHYSEPLVGEALKRLSDQGISRESLFLQTKFTPLDGQDPHQIPYDPRASIQDQIAQSFEASLTNLQTTYLDSLVLHSPLAPHDRLMAAWRAMETIFEARGSRQLGISNCYELELLQALHADARVKPAVVQNRFYAATEYDTRLRRWCADQGIIYQSFWTLTANPHVLSSVEVQAMTARHGKTAAQILFRYLNLAGIVPLIGTSSLQHMSEDLAILDLELTADEVSTLDGVFNRA